MTVGTQILVGAGHWPGASCPVNRIYLGDRKWSRQIHPRSASFKHRGFPWDLKKKTKWFSTSNHCESWCLKLEHSNFYMDYGNRMQNERNIMLLQMRGGSFVHTFFELFRSRRQKQLGYEKCGWKPLTWSNSHSFSQVKTAEEPFRKETCGKIMIKAELTMLLLTFT